VQRTGLKSVCPPNVGRGIIDGCPPILPNPNSPNPISPNRYTLGLGIGLGPGFDYFRQYNVIRRIGIRRNGAEPIDVRNHGIFLKKFTCKSTFCCLLASFGGMGENIFSSQYFY